MVIGSRDLSAGQVAARALGPEIRAEQLDVSDPDSIAECERRLAYLGVEVDILVNNAGCYTTTPLLVIDERALVDALEVNLIGAWRTARAFVPGMRARKWGRVVNISTGYAHFAERAPQAGAYGLAKASFERPHTNDRRRGGCRREGQRDVARLGRNQNGRQQRATLGPGGSRHPVWLATLPDNGPTDGFYHDRQRIPW